MFVPEAELPDWVVCYIPALMSFLNILPAPRSFPFIIPYLLFDNTKFNAMISGLFQLGSAYEWVVTKKSGRSSEDELDMLVSPKQRNNRHKAFLNAATGKERPKQPAPPLREHHVGKKKKYNRTYKKELTLSLLRPEPAVETGGAFLLPAVPGWTSSARTPVGGNEWMYS
jgi:hypothetical protein